LLFTTGKNASTTFLLSRKYVRVLKPGAPCGRSRRVPKRDEAVLLRPSSVESLLKSDHRPLSIGQTAKVRGKIGYVECAQARGWTVSHEAGVKPVVAIRDEAQ